MKYIVSLTLCFTTPLLASFRTQASDLSGSWTTGCHQGLSKEQALDEAHSITTENFYRDQNCKLESFQFKTTGTLQFPSENSSWINFSYEMVQLTVYDQQVVADLNARKVCGIGDWRSEEPQIITGLQCALFNVNKETQIAKVADQKFGIYKLQEGRLYFGQLSRDKDGSAPSKRPTTWAPEFYQK